MKSFSDNAEVLGGILIALGLLVLGIGAFAVLARQGREPASDIPDRRMTTVASPEQHVNKAPVSAAALPQVASPAAATLSARSDTSKNPGGHGLNPVPSPAAQALRQVLQNYRNDPHRTATITISSTGRISAAAPGPLTAHDGLPLDALDGATIISGPGRGGAH
jgi:hypothetical protein